MLFCFYNNILHGNEGNKISFYEKNNENIVAKKGHASL